MWYWIKKFGWRKAENPLENKFGFSRTMVKVTALWHFSVTNGAIKDPVKDEEFEPYLQQQPPLQVSKLEP